MNDDIGTQILDELRKQKRIGIRLGIIGMVVMVGAVCASIAYREISPSWSTVNKQLDRGNTARALSIALQLVEKNPNDYYAHREIGNVYLEMNDITNAERHYAISHKLYPGEYSSKILETLHRRMGQTNSAETMN